MRIISFSNASAQPLSSFPVQGLTRWVTRVKNSLNRIATSSSTQQVVNNEQQVCLPDTSTTKEHSAFAIAPQVLLLRCHTVTKTSSPSSLKVVREVDLDISPDCAGRMVISGRMADVCAELDRMAVRATAAH